MHGVANTSYLSALPESVVMQALQVGRSLGSPVDGSMVFTMHDASRPHGRTHASTR